MTIADFGLFNAERLCLTVDAFASGAPIVHGVIEGTLTIEQGAHQAAFLPIEVLDTAFGFRELLVVTDLTCPLGEEQRTAKALSAVAVGVLEEKDRVHAQAFGAVRSAIRIARHLLVAVIVQGNGSNTLSVCHRFVDVPEIIGRIDCDMGGILIECDDRTLVERTEIGDIGCIERQGVSASTTSP